MVSFVSRMTNGLCISSKAYLPSVFWLFFFSSFFEFFFLTIELTYIFPHLKLLFFFFLSVSIR